MFDVKEIRADFPGHPLSPQAEKHVKKIIGKMCESLPARTTVKGK